MRIDRLAEIRRLRGYTLEELARRTNISKSQVYRIEAGTSQPSGDAIKAFARELEVSADYLLGLVSRVSPVLDYSLRTGVSAQCSLDNAYTRQTGHALSYGFIGSLRVKISKTSVLPSRSYSIT